MKIYAPNYYKEFSCIAEKCKNNCCIGWEIDIDPDTMRLYKSIKGPFGKRLSASIDTAETPHFILSGGDRCPFLNEHNLCDIISELGENCLCQICSDHPRYRNFFSGRIEMGLGMCCEEAVRIILSSREKTSLSLISCDKEKTEQYEDEEYFFNLRDKIIAILQNRNLSINDRICKLECEFDISLPNKTIQEWVDFFLSLERLNSKWTDILNVCRKNEISGDYYDFSVEFEQLLVYFIYRHLADGVYDGMFLERILFALLSFLMIKTIFDCGEKTTESLCEIARLYSCEIEYSEDNMNKILELLSYEK